MKILCLTYHFAPYNHIGALRTTKTVKYLLKAGHDVRVIAAADQPFPPTLELEFSRSVVTYAPCVHLDRGAQILRSGPSTGGRTLFRRVVTRLLRRPYDWYKALLWYPDNVRFWRTELERQARSIIASWRPDLILASAPPFTVLTAASHIAREHGIPWVCELRDLWVDYHDYRYPSWRRHFERRLERRVLRTAAGFITVSEPLADTIATHYSQPVCIVPNGFDPDDYTRAEPMDDLPRDTFNVVYTGTIYKGKQDISPLFEALRILGSTPMPVRVHMYGRSLDRLSELAKRFGVEKQVRFAGEVSHKEALAIQRKADVLLLLSWNDESQKGIFTGKLFEYLGARRPILCIGRFESVATELIRARNAGYIARTTEQAANALREAVVSKQSEGTVADLPEHVCRGFSRSEQVQRVATFLTDILSKPNRSSVSL